CLRLSADGNATVRLADLPTASIERVNHVETRDLCGPLQRGPNALEARFSRPEGGVPFFELSELAMNGQVQVLTPDRLLRVPASSERIDLDCWLGRGVWGIDLLVVAVVLLA